MLYRRPGCGLEGAGEGGRSLPCKSTRGNDFFAELADSEAPLAAPDPDADIAAGRGRDG